MKKILIVANWKMNPADSKSAQRLFDLVRKEIAGMKNSETVFCPPFVYIPYLNISISKYPNIALGGQDCFWEESGAYTGEISPLMLKNFGCRYVICGHSERRENLNETNEMVAKKIRQVLKVGLTPILCVGERSRQIPDYEKFIQDEVRSAMLGVSRGLISNIIIAYEPVWAIGSGRPATSDDALSAGLLIRKTLAGIAGRAVAEKSRIIYGGSVTSQNAKSYTVEAGLGGLLVGGASLNASEFIKIVRSFE